MRYHVLYFLPVVMALMFACAGQEKELPEDKDRLEQTDALDSLSNILAKDSLDPVVLHERARLYLERGMVNEALGDLARALEIRPGNSDIYLTLADAYLMMGKIPNCIEALQKAEQLDPANNDALLKLAEIYLVLQDYQNTHDYVRKALDLDTRNPRAYFIRGYALMETGDTTAAIRSMQNALDQDQEYYEAAVQLGVLLSETGNPLAEEYYEAAIAIDPNRDAAYYLLGMHYQELERMAEALQIYERLMTVNPGFKEAYYNSGYIFLVHYEDFQKAIAYFNQALDQDARYIDALYNRGFAYELSGDYPSARRDYQQVLEIRPNYELAVNGLNRLDRATAGN